MDFKEATSQAIELGITLDEMADLMGVSRATLVAARVEVSKPNYRKPPSNWAPALRHILQSHSAALLALANRLPAFNKE
jgi:hypothetical protein